MLTGEPDARVMSEQTIELIAQRVIAAIRDDLDAIAHGLSGPAAAEQLTVGQVARQLGVARSTVYAHWREWGGYKLGAGKKAPIRFDSTPHIVASDSSPHQPPPGKSAQRRKKRPRRDLLADAPRLAPPLDGIA
jgi:transposase-like protein